MKRIVAPCFLALLVLLTACVPGQEPADGADGILLYYLVPEDLARGGDRIRGVREDLGLPEDAAQQEAALAVVRRLMAGDPEAGLESPLPADVELLGVEVRDRLAYVDFSDGFGRLAGVELALADYCLTLSLTGLEGVNGVSVTARGQAVPRQPKTAFYERDVLLSNMDDVIHTEEVTLYFLNDEGVLDGESRVLEVYEGQTLADNVVTALLAGPEDRSLSRVIPENFQVSFVRVESGVCYIGIPAASLELLPEDTARQRLILHSLADSLYSLDSVGEIRLMSDGAELTTFGETPVEEVAVRPE